MDHASARATVVDGVAIASAPASAIVGPRVAGLHHWEPGGWRLADYRANPITAFRSGTTGERRRDGLDTDRGSYECFGHGEKNSAGGVTKGRSFQKRTCWTRIVAPAAVSTRGIGDALLSSAHSARPIASDAGVQTLRRRSVRSSSI
jgi:hypothetical protein